MKRKEIGVKSMEGKSDLEKETYLVERCSLLFKYQGERPPVLRVDLIDRQTLEIVGIAVDGVLWEGYHQGIFDLEMVEYVMIAKLKARAKLDKIRYPGERSEAKVMLDTMGSTPWKKGVENV